MESVRSASDSAVKITTHSTHSHIHCIRSHKIILCIFTSQLWVPNTAFLFLFIKTPKFLMARFVQSTDQSEKHACGCCTSTHLTPFLQQVLLRRSPGAPLLLQLCPLGGRRFVRVVARKSRSQSVTVIAHHSVGQLEPNRNE